jgi:hypothetical protein
MTFNPNDYGDPYTKRTCLWGEFNTPVRTPVEATEGSKMHLRTARPGTPGDPVGDAGLTDPIDVLAFGLPSTSGYHLAEWIQDDEHFARWIPARMEVAPDAGEGFARAFFEANP